MLSVDDAVRVGFPRGVAHRSKVAFVPLVLLVALFGVLLIALLTPLRLCGFSAAKIKHNSINVAKSILWVIVECVRWPARATGLWCDRPAPPFYQEPVKAA